MASSTFPESLCWLELPTHSCTIFSEVWSGTCKASQWHSAWHNFGCMHSAWHNFGCMHGRLRFPGRPTKTQRICSINNSIPHFVGHFIRRSNRESGSLRRSCNASRVPFPFKTRFFLLSFSLVDSRHLALQPVKKKSSMPRGHMKKVAGMSKWTASMPPRVF